MTPGARDTFCSHCGTRFEQSESYPRVCRACGAQTWANPIPVAVALVPVDVGGRVGLLVVRRAIPPVGRLALVGGFVEAHESWQACAARELREEANVDIADSAFAPFWFASSEPRPDRVLVFGTCRPLVYDSLPAFTPNAEASERSVVFNPDEAGDLAFPLHTEAARRYFAAR